MDDQTGTSFSSRHEIQVLIRPQGSDAGSWQELDCGPGYFHIDPGMEVGVRIRQSDDETLEEIFGEIRSCGNITHLNISENRKVTDDGLEGLVHFPHLTELNLSSCDITDDIFSILRKSSRLRILNLSFCNRISDLGLRALTDLRNLTNLDLQGCPRITRAGLARIEKPNLTIHKHK
jgi:Leucine-rich repeat (LRR) protein